MKKAFIICLYCVNAFACLGYSFSAIAGSEDGINNDPILTLSDSVTAQQNDKLLVNRNHRTSVVNDGSITVSINPLQNMALVCKGDVFALIAQVTSTNSDVDISDSDDPDAAPDADISDDPDVTYEWYYVEQDGTEVPIVSTVSATETIVVAGKLLTITKGLQLTTEIPAEATAFSIADNIPGLSEILSEAKKNITGSSLLPDLDNLLSQLPDELKKDLKDGGKEIMKQAVQSYIGTSVDKYLPREYTMPIGVRVTIDGITKEAAPFTRPVFERPNMPTYTITPTSCCQGEVITFKSDDNQSDLYPEKSAVMYMWMGFPNPGLSSGGAGLIFVPNLDKSVTKGPFSITMNNPKAYTGNYTLMAYRGAPSPIGCSSFAIPTSVTVYSKPTSDRNTKLKTNTGKQAYCEGEEITIDSDYSGARNINSDVGLGVTYKWYDVNGNEIKANDTRFELSKNTTFGEDKNEYLKIKKPTSAMSGVYTRVATSNKGCKAAATITINISPKPAAPVGLNANTPICVGDNLVLSVAPAQNAEKYIWTYPNNTGGGRGVKTIETTDPGTTIINPKAGKYQVQVRNTGGCLSSPATITVHVLSSLNAFSVTIISNAPVIEGARLSLSTTLIPGATYEWEGPAGFRANHGNSLIRDHITLAMAGLYKLTVRKEGCSASGSIKIEVYPKSVLDILNTNLTRIICSGDHLEIPLSSSFSDTKYKWVAHCTGNVSGSLQHKHDVLKIEEKLKNDGAALGTVTYTVTPIFKKDGIEIAGNSKDFVVTVVPIVKGTIANTRKVSKNTRSFDWTPELVGPSNKLVTYKWYADPGKKNPIVNGVKADGTYKIETPKPGIYTYYVATTDHNSACESEPSKVELHAEHEIMLSFDQSKIEQGQNATLTASLSGTLIAPSDGITITLHHTKSSFHISPTIYIPAGSQSASMIIVTTKSHTMDEDEILTLNGIQSDGYTIIGQPTLSIQSNPSIRSLKLKFNETSVHGGQRATLTVQLPAGIKATKPITIVLQRDGRKSTAHEDQNYVHLQKRITIEVGANSKTIYAFTAKNNGVIDGLAKLVLTETPPIGYIIEKPNSEIDILDKTGNDPDNRIIKLAFEKPTVVGGDVNKLTISLPKGITSAKKIVITLDKDKRISTAKRGVDYESFPDVVTIEVGKNHNTIQLKTMGDDKAPKITTLLVNGKALDDQYKVLSSAQTDIIRGLHIPNTFTPGGIGSHPTWIISGLQFYPDCDVKVFNRWGQVVFTSHGYAEPWNGGYENNLGKSVPVGTYYYVIELSNFHQGAKRILKGYVAIIR